jgi:hypothetical protein
MAQLRGYATSDKSRKASLRVHQGDPPY